jgi:hypothetical protein
MTSDSNRIAAAAGSTVDQIIGPIEVDSLRLFDASSNIGWGTALYNVRALVAIGSTAEPIIFDGTYGQISLIVPVEIDWRLYAEFEASWPTDRRFRWQSLMAGNGAAEGQIDPVGSGPTWYFATPPFGPEGELVIDITALGAQDPAEEFQLTMLRFWLFR